MPSDVLPKVVVTGRLVFYTANVAFQDSSRELSCAGIYFIVGLSFRTVSCQSPRHGQQNVRDTKLQKYTLKNRVRRK